MRTDKLIDMLSTNLEPVDFRQAWRRLTAAIAIGIVVAACLMMLALGIRPDLVNAPALLSLCLKLLLTGAMVVLAAMALNKAMRPGGERKASIVPTMWLRRGRSFDTAVRCTPKWFKTSQATAPSVAWRSSRSRYPWMRRRVPSFSL